MSSRGSPDCTVKQQILLRRLSKQQEVQKNMQFEKVLLGNEAISNCQLLGNENDVNKQLSSALPPAAAERLSCCRVGVALTDHSAALLEALGKN